MRRQLLCDGGAIELGEDGDTEVFHPGTVPHLRSSVWGDRALLVLVTADLEAIKKLQVMSRKVIVVLVSGRPLLVTDEIASLDAVIAAWLPGSEGAGVIDVLFDDASFVGTLPLPWPRTSGQLPIGIGGETADGSALLFPRGYSFSNVTILLMHYQLVSTKNGILNSRSQRNSHKGYQIEVSILFYVQ